MYRLHGEILIKFLLIVFWLFFSPSLWAISVGNLTFSLDSEKEYISKKVINNNKSGRLYRISVTEIDKPGGNELQIRPIDGELLFTPKQLTLQAGESEYFKFYYHGPKDDRERYYRVSFREIPTRNYGVRNITGSEVSMEPVVVLDTILVVRPRQIDFKWTFDKTTGAVSNIGNTWFKLLIKAGCDSTEEDADVWYLRPGERINREALRKPGNHYIIYNDKFIRLSKDCITGS